MSNTYLDEFAIQSTIPDVPADNLYIEAAHKLKEIAEDYPIGKYTLWFNRIVSWLTRKKINRFTRKYVTTVGLNNVRLILTKRLTVKPTWHLSALPVLNGELFDWELKAIRKAFEIPMNCIFERDGDEFVWYWE